MYSIRFAIVTAALSALLLAGNASAAPKLQADAAMTKLAMSASPRAVRFERCLGFRRPSRLDELGD